MCQVVFKLLPFSPGSEKMKTRVLIVLVLYATLSAMVHSTQTQKVTNLFVYMELKVQLIFFPVNATVSFFSDLQFL